MKTRLLFLAPLYPPVLGGAELQARDLARAMAAAGAEIEVLTTKVKGAPREETDGGVTVHRRVPTIPYRGLWAASNLLGAFNWLFTEGYRFDGFLGFGLTSLLNPPALLRQQGGLRPIVVRCECSGPFGDVAAMRGMISAPLLFRSARRYKRIVALTDMMRDELVEAGFSHASIEVLPNGVDIAFFAPPADGGRETRLLSLGRLAPQKGLPLLLEAFARLAAARPELELDFLGDGPERDNLAAQAKELGIDGRVHFRGIVGRDEVRDALQRAAVLVHPTRGEGMCVALLETMAAGCPVVTTDIPANRALLEDGRDCVMVPPEDAVALADAVGRLLDDPEGTGRLADAARQKVEANFSMKAMAERYLELFAKLRRESLP